MSAQRARFRWLWILILIGLLSLTYPLTRILAANMSGGDSRYSEILLAGPGFMMPDPPPDDCSKHKPSFDAYPNPKVYRLTGTSTIAKDFQYVVRQGDEQLAWVYLVRRSATTGETVLDLEIVQLFLKQNSGIATRAALEVLSQATPSILTELGLNQVKVTFTDIHNAGWKCLLHFHPLVRGQTVEIGPGPRFIYPEFFILK